MRIALTVSTVTLHSVNRLHGCHLYSRTIVFISGSALVFDSSLHCQRVSIAFTVSTVTLHSVNRLHACHLYSRTIVFISGSALVFDSSLHCQRVSIAFTGLWCKLKFCEQTTCL